MIESERWKKSNEQAIAWRKVVESQRPHWNGAGLMARVEDDGWCHLTADHGGQTMRAMFTREEAADFGAFLIRTFGDPAEFVNAFLRERAKQDGPHGPEVSSVVADEAAPAPAAPERDPLLGPPAPRTALEIAAESPSCARCQHTPHLHLHATVDRSGACVASSWHFGACTVDACGCASYDDGTMVAPAEVEA